MVEILWVHFWTNSNPANITIKWVTWAFWLPSAYKGYMRFYTVLCVCASCRFSSIWLSVTLWTVTHQAPLSMRFSSQEYWTRLPYPPPGDLPNPRIKPAYLTSPALAGGFFTTSATWEAPWFTVISFVASLSLCLQKLYTQPLHVLDCKICSPFHPSIPSAWITIG